MTENPLYGRKESPDDGEETYDSRVLTKLIRNYRSHPSILKLPNEMFYDNELEVHANEMVRSTFTSWENLPKKVSCLFVSSMFGSCLVFAVVYSYLSYYCSIFLDIVCNSKIKGSDSPSVCSFYFKTNKCQ